MINTFKIMSLTSGHANAQASIPLNSISESFAYGLRMAIIGMATVFVVLILLMIILNVFKLMFSKNGESDKRHKSEEKNIIAESDIVQQNDNGELVAAITAAIQCFRSQNEPSAGGFRVVSFKKR